jgi:hypothetical protein
MLKRAHKRVKPFKDGKITLKEIRRAVNADRRVRI